MDEPMTVFCNTCGSEIRGTPNMPHQECNKCFMNRIDPKHEPWLDDPDDDLYQAECVACGKPNGPLLHLDEDFAGWLCDDCYEEMQKDHPEVDDV